MVGQFHDRHRAILCRASRQPSCGTRARRLCHKTAFLSPHCSTLCLATIALSCNAHIASSITLPPPARFPPPCSHAESGHPAVTTQDPQAFTGLSAFTPPQSSDLLGGQLALDFFFLLIAIQKTTHNFIMTRKLVYSCGLWLTLASTCGTTFCRGNN